MEEVNRFKYLGFMFQINGRFGSHIEQMASAAKRAVAQVWSIGERKFIDNFTIRKQMFYSLVVPAMTYACEITGYAERDVLEAQARKYFRWTLGLRQGTRNAIVMDEVKILPMHIVTGNRAMKYEEKIPLRPCLVLRECFKDLQNGANNHWAKERAAYCHRGGLGLQWTQEEINNGNRPSAQMLQTQIDSFGQLQEVTIRKLRYAQVRPCGVPLYLRHCSEIKTIARFRCENEEWGRDRWRTERRCRVCGLADETLEHQVENCATFAKSVTGLLCESGRGLEDMRRLIEIRMY